MTPEENAQYDRMCQAVIAADEMNQKLAAEVARLTGLVQEASTREMYREHAWSVDVSHRHAAEKEVARLKEAIAAHEAERSTQAYWRVGELLKEHDAVKLKAALLQDRITVALRAADAVKCTYIHPDELEQVVFGAFTQMVKALRDEV
jgi:hypothetical protein